MVLSEYHLTPMGQSLVLAWLKASHSRRGRGAAVPLYGVLTGRSWLQALTQRQTHTQEAMREESSDLERLKLWLTLQVGRRPRTP